jgi:two-component system alkaline phosphatase synthesis response regulator PhoP
VAERRILVVEDDTTLCEVIAEALLEDDYAVETAGDGQAALELARRWRPDLVILDLMLPHGDGEQLAAALRRVGGLASIPIIVVSASRAAGEAGARLEATAALRKPFDLFELTQRVNDVLR